MLNISEYQRTVSDDYPVVNLGSEREPRYFPMEVCEVLRGQPARMDLNPAQRKVMSRVAIRPAHQNAASIANQFQSMLRLNEPTSILPSWPAALGKQLTQVEGRVLLAPLLQYAGSPQRPMDGSWNLAHIAFVKPIKNFIWGVICLLLGDPIPYAEFKRSFQVFQQGMRNLGLTPARLMFDDQKFRLQGTMQSDLDKFAKDLGEFFKLQGKGKQFYENAAPKILLVVGPEDTKVFNRLKQELETVLGIRSVYVTNSRFTQKKGDPQLMANLLMKWNLQLGGINQKLVESHGGLWGDGKTLFFGYDITHPSPSSIEDEPSIAPYVGKKKGYKAQFPAI